MKKLLWIVFVGLVFSSCNRESNLITNTGFAFGRTYTIKYYALDAETDFKDEIELLLNEINKSISVYLPTSDVSRINDGDNSIVVDEHFKNVFLKSYEVWTLTNGAFDPTVGGLVNAWGFGTEQPIDNISQKDIDSILQFTGFDKVTLTKEGRIIKTHPQVTLNFSGLSKGYAIDRIGAMFESNGIKEYYIQMGAEMLVKGEKFKTVHDAPITIENPDGQNPQQLSVKFTMENQSLGTSGNYRRFRVDSETGEHYVHTINVKTGYPQQSNVLSSLVLSTGSAMEADAYATALLVMKLEDAKQLLKKIDHIEGFIVSADADGDIQQYTTQGFREAEKIEGQFKQ